MTSARGYDLLAPFYDVLAFAVFGNSLYKAQVQFLGDIPQGSKLLVLGGGTGRWLREAAIHRANPEITYVDASSAMIQKARENGRGLNIRFVHGTHELLRGDEGFDAVVAFCFFDLFDMATLRGVVDRIKTSMTSRARWMIVDFVNRKWWHSAMLFMMYGFFRIVTSLKLKRLPAWQEVMRINGIRLEKSRAYYGGFIESDLWLTAN